VDVLRRKIYENCRTFSPEGKLMFLCAQSKADWYLRKNLATIIQTNPFSIQLSFVPNGDGHNDQFLLQERKSICCVCGTNSNLTKHHVVPYCYRRYLVKIIRDYLVDYHDVLPICAKCHFLYEKNFASKLKKQISNQYGVPLDGIGLNTYEYKNKHRIRNLANVLISYYSKIPKKRIEEIKLEIASLLGSTIENIDLKLLAKQKIKKPKLYQSHGKLVVEKIDNCQEFVEMWRKHFIENANPQFMPDMWSLNRPIDVCKD